MTTMKNFFSMLMLATAMLFAFVACKDDDDSPGVNFGAPELNAVSSSYQQVPGESVNIQLNANADAGIKTIAVSGAVTGNVSFNADDNNQLVSYAFEVPADAEEGEDFALTFTLTDDTDKTATANVTVTATATPVNSEVIEIATSTEGVGTTTWTANNTYVLQGFVYVNPGQTLTIEPGTVIKGRAGTGAEASALIIADGARIIANGTPENPIIFTALADDVTRTDEIEITARGLWGGLIILGNAPINHANSRTLIEGLPSNDTETRGTYGGDDPEHDAGELSYVSIRHGGSNIGADNEINGLTMGGVGRGTTIHHIEVWGNDDDGFEWFGGTVNTSYLASIYNQDDAFDWDFGYRGENQFWFAHQEPDFTNSGRGMELDGAHSGNLDAEVFSRPTIFNMTLIGQGLDGEVSENAAIFMTEGSGGYFHNSIVSTFPTGIMLNTKGSAGATTTDRLANGDLIFSNNIFYNISDYTELSAVAEGTASLETHLSVNNNVFADPQLDGFLPTSGGAAFTTSGLEVPATSVNGFTYEAVDFLGAFGEDNWLEGWTAADLYEIF